MRAGRLRKRVALQEPIEHQSASGEVSVTWSIVSRWWAEIEPLSAREFINADQRIAEVTHKIRLRRCSILTHRHRILFDGRSFEITAILDTAERGIEQVIMAKELAA